MFYNKKEVMFMKFNVDVHLKIDGTGMFSGGSFTARRKSDIPGVAHQYIQEIKRETGFRPTLIEKVMVNGSEDITDKVQKIEND
jgi:hypothetical protein